MRRPATTGAPVRRVSAACGPDPSGAAGIVAAVPGPNSQRSVARIRVTPVKATAIRTVDQVRLEPFGVLDNRRFYLADGRGELVCGPKHGRLLQIHSCWSPDTEILRVEFPDGASVEAASDRVTGSPVATDFYGRRTVVGHEVDGPFSAAISDWYGQRLRVVRTDRPGEANDVEPLSLMSTASAASLAEGSGSDRPLETRRFRMLFELAGCEPYEEDTWNGRLLRLGEAVIRVGGQIPRCAVTTYDPDTGVRDFGTLHAIKRLRGENAARKLPFGVYGEVVEPGTVGVGDPATPVPGPASP